MSGEIIEAVRERYASLARPMSDSSCCGQGTCCAPAEGSDGGAPCGSACSPEELQDAGVDAVHTEHAVEGQGRIGSAYVRARKDGPGA